MPTILTINEQRPVIHPSVFLAKGVIISGDVQIEAHSSIWFHTVIRGDVCSIRIGEQVNIQDGSMVHGTLGKSETIIGNHVSIGHRAIVHGCTIHDHVLIGMGAIVLDGAIIESQCIVAAGAVVLENAHLESGFLYGGVPARKIKPVDANSAAYYIEATAKGYTEFAKWYQ